LRPSAGRKRGCKSDHLEPFLWAIRRGKAAKKLRVFQLVAETLRRRCYTSFRCGLITPKIASSQTPLERLPYLNPSFVLNSYGRANVGGPPPGRQRPRSQREQVGGRYVAIPGEVPSPGAFLGSAGPLLRKRRFKTVMGNTPIVLLHRGSRRRPSSIARQMSAKEIRPKTLPRHQRLLTR
jgi:hypothetical protein